MDGALLSHCLAAFLADPRLSQKELQNVCVAQLIFLLSAGSLLAVKLVEYRFTARHIFKYSFASSWDIPLDKSSH